VSLSVWIGIALFLAGTALYVAAEFAAVGVRRSRVQRLADDGNPWARRLLPFVASPAGLDRYVGASQIGITLTSLILGAFAQATVAVSLAPMLASTFRLDPVSAVSTSAVVVLIGLTAVQVVLGELVPKSLALQFPTETALATVLPMQWSLAVFRPFLTLLNGSAALALRLVGVKATTHRHIHSPDEIELLIAESRDGGLLEPDELERLRKALRLSLRRAGDLMVPRQRVQMIAAGTGWPAVLDVVSQSQYSRLPVYRETPERVIGTLRVKDVAQRFVAGGPPPSIEQLMRPVLRLAADLPGDQVIARLREARAHQAVVVDDSDRVVGLVTIEDVLGAFLRAGPLVRPEPRP
jgi:CBS domain containing-hemolysin-like protein